MAITWGSYKVDGSNAMRLGYEITQSPSSVGSGTSSVDLTLKVYFGTKYSVSDSLNSFNLSGSWGTLTGSSRDINHTSSSAWSSSNVTLLITDVLNVPTSYAGTVSRSFSASMSGINAIAGTVSVSGSHTVARRPYVAPNPPSAVTVGRSTDSAHYVSWTRNSTTAGPYTVQHVERWDDASGVYKRIASSISGSASSYSDLTTVPNRRYRYQIVAGNSAGTSSGGETSRSPYFRTSPAAPGTPTAKKSGTAIVLNWSRYAYDVAYYEVQDYANGVAGSVFTTGANAWTYTHTAPDTTKTHAYRVRARFYESAFGVTLNSDWTSLSNTIQLLAAPNAPTGLSPASGAIDVTDPVTLRWSHNPVDTTDQSAYSIRWRPQGSSTWTTIAKTSSGTSSRVMPGGTFTNGTSIEWQVQTWGDHATASPWSSTAVFEASARPGVSIIAPTGVLAGSQIVAEWSYFDPEVSPQIAARVSIYQGATTADRIGTANLTGDVTSHVLSTRAEDGQTYTVGVEVRDASGLWSEQALSTFTVDYASPPAPEFSAQWNDDTGSVSITYIVPAADATQVEAVSVEVWRSANGSDWALVASGLPLDSTFVDPIPATHGVNHYRVTAVSALPSMTDSLVIPVAVPLNGWIYLNAGPGFSQVVRIGEDAAPDYAPDRSRARHHFAGRDYPLEVSGQARTFGVSFSARFGPDSSTWEEWQYLTDLDGPFCYRDPTVRMFVGGVKFGHSHSKMTRRMTFSAERTDFSE